MNNNTKAVNLLSNDSIQDIRDVLNTLDVVKFLLKDPNDLSSNYDLIVGLKTIVDNLYLNNQLVTFHQFKYEL
jgi:hypothetical protein